MAVRFRADRGNWQAQVFLDGKRVARHFATEQEATQWEQQHQIESLASLRLQEIISASQREGSLAHLVSTCKRLDWAGKDPSQWENACRLAQLLGPDTHAAELTMRALDDLVVELRGQGLSNTTIKKYLSACSVMLKRACRLGFIESMPLMPEKRTLKTPEPRDLVITDEWLAQQLDAFEKRENRLSIALTLFLRQMGCRVGEALDLTWDRVDLKARKVQFVKTKGAMPRRLPLTDDMVKLLKAAKAHGTAAVFPIGYGTYLSQYSHAKHAACDALQLGPTVRKEWVIHTLRHTRITELASMGWQAPAIQQWAGHASLQVTQRYIHAAGINLEELLQC
jgi:integrase